MTTLSVIVPTIGRPSLRGTLESVLPQLQEGDELIVVGDGPRPAARTITQTSGPCVSYHETAPTGSWGHAQRMLGMELARGRYLAFLDDDDIWLPGARKAIARGITEYPGAFLICRMRYQHFTLWTTPDLRFENVSTQMFIVPNLPGRLGEWRADPSKKNGSGGDFLFAWDTVALMAGRMVFYPAVIAKLSAHSGGRGAGGVAAAPNAS